MLNSINFLFNANIFKKIGFKFNSQDYSYLYDYHTFFEKYENYKSLLSFLNSENFKEYEKTDTKILFKGNIEFGLKNNVIKKIVGKPLQCFNTGDIQTHEVYFYKWHLGGYRTKAELHFLDNIFFMGIYNFDGYSQVEYIKIKKMLIEKYRLSENSINRNKIALADTDNNLILMQNEPELSILYFTGDKSVLPNLLNQSANLEFRIKEKEEKSKNQMLSFI